MAVEPKVREPNPSASFQFRFDPDKIDWLYARILNLPMVELYKGSFPEPFTDLTYVAQMNQGRLFIAALLGIGTDFTARYGPTVGTTEDLSPLIRRYPDAKFTPDGQRLMLIKDDQIQGVIARPDENHLVIQRDGGQLEAGSPINALATQIDQANLLVQRYISAIWKADPEFTHRHLSMRILNIPYLPENALRTYFSTFEILGEKFRVHPRPVDLDEDIGGYTALKDAIRSLVLDLRKPEISVAFGTQPFSNRFLLVSGETGRGKSLLAKAIDHLLRAIYGDSLESFELPLTDMITQFGTNTVDVVQTIFDHVRENDRNGVPTFLHLDGMQALIPFRQSSNQLASYSEAELSYSLQTLNPLHLAIRSFGSDIGQRSQYVTVFGESRAPREQLPDAVARTFRRAYSVDHIPEKDYISILMVHIRTIRSFAQRVGSDPFISGIEAKLPAIAPFAEGLTGQDLRQALDDIAARHKAGWKDGEVITQTTDKEIADELRVKQLAKGIHAGSSQPAMGFLPMARTQQ